MSHCEQCGTKTAPDWEWCGICLRGHGPAYHGPLTMQAAEIEAEIARVKRRLDRRSREEIALDEKWRRVANDMYSAVVTVTLAEARRAMFRAGLLAYLEHLQVWLRDIPDLAETNEIRERFDRARQRYLAAHGEVAS